MSEWLLLHLFSASVRVLAPALAAAAALWCMRKRWGAAARHALWTAVLVSMLVLLTTGALVPPLAVRVLPAAPAPAVMPEAAAGPVVVSGAAAPSAAVPAAPAPRGPWEVAAWIYAAGALLLLGRFGAGLAAASRLRRASRPVETDEDLEAAVAESDRVVVPVTIGWLHPLILLPGAWREWPDAKLRAVLAHELAHVRRRDGFTGALAAVGKALFWFHPLAWFLERRLATLAEQAADDAGVVAAGDAAQYARTLLEMAGALEADGARVSWAGAAMARCSRIGARIDRVLEGGRELSRGLSKRGWAALLVCGIPLLYGAAAVQVDRMTLGVYYVNGSDISDYVKAMIDGARLTTAGAQELEQHLASNPDDLAARVKLISYYYQNAMNEARIRHVLWLVEHHPASEVFNLNIFWMSPNEAPNTRADHEAVRKAWLDQVGKNPMSARVIVNAARFIGRDDPSVAADLLKQARQAEPGNRAWTSLLAGLYSTAIRHPQDLAFSRAVQAELEASTDADLLGSAGEFLANPITGTDPTVQLGERLLKRAQSLDPKNPTWPRVLQMLANARAVAVKQTAQPSGTQRIRIGAKVAQSYSVKQVPPVYPPQAQQARIQGAVRLQITIGPEGDVRNVQLISGHPLLVQAAVDAVKQWVYKPILLSGAAVEVVTEVDVNFALPAAPASGSAGDETLERIDLDSLPPDLRNTLSQRLARYQGQPLTQALMDEIRGTVYGADRRLALTWGFRDVRVTLADNAPLQTLAQATVPPGENPANIKRIRVGSNVQERNLLTRVDPVYPPLAKQARIQGTVRFSIIVGTDGHVTNMELLSGHPLLVSAAQDALKQWVYRPTLLNGEPVEVVTQADVNFTLLQPNL